MPRKKATTTEDQELQQPTELADIPQAAEATVPPDPIMQENPPPPESGNETPVQNSPIPVETENTALAVEDEMTSSAVAEPAHEETDPGSESPDTAEVEEHPVKSDRQSFYDLDFNELDRDLTAEERQEWNSIYASYRSHSALTGTVIGVDRHAVSIRSGKTGEVERRTMYCAVVVPYRVRIVIPAAEMWDQGDERPDFVLQNMVGATIDFIISKVDREGGFAIASRRQACRAQRQFFAGRPALHQIGARLRCRVLSVGPRRCLVECYGHDINLTQRELRFTAIPDLRDVYRPGEELECVVTGYDARKNELQISVKETQANPFDGAELRHPVGSRRQAVIAGKYGGGVFCNLPDNTVCLCSYSYQHDDSDFMVGDTVILVIQRYDLERQRIYGKILIKR